MKRMISSALIALSIAAGSMLPMASAQAANVGDGVLDVCLAGKGYTYDKVGRIFVNKERRTFLREMGFKKVNFRNLAGGEAILDGIKDGSCDVGITPTSVLALRKANGENFYYSKPMFREPFQMICNKDSGVDSYSDFDSAEVTVGVMPDSGSETALNVAIGLDPDALQPDVMYGPDYEHLFTKPKEVYMAVRNGVLDCGLMVGGFGSKTMLELDKEHGDKLKMVKFSSSNLGNDHEALDAPLFIHVELSSSVYKNMVGYGNVETMADTARLVFNSQTFSYSDVTTINDRLDVHKGKIRNVAKDDKIGSDWF